MTATTTAGWLLRREELPLAGVGQRLAAGLLDLLLVGVVYLPVLAAAQLSEGSRAVVLLAVLCCLAVLTAVQVTTQARTGATFGKALLGLQVVGEADCQVLGLRRTVLRLLAFLVIPATALWPLFDHYNRAVADIVTGSLVVQSPAAPRTAMSGLAAVPLIATLLGTTLLTGGLAAAAGSPATAAAAPAPPSAAPSPAAPSPSPTPTVPVGQLPLEDLESRLATPGDDYTPLSDRVTELGDVGADSLIDRQRMPADEREAAKAGLRLLGFEKARGHGYDNEDAVVTLLVYRFKTAEGAQELMELSREDATGTFTSRTVPGAFTWAVKEGVYNLQLGMFARGRFVYEITVLTPEPEPDHATFDAVLLRQRNVAVRADP
jgi:uncharacterized RDD family membrane protein YckC